MRILLIDDDPLVRRSCARALQGARHEVSSAETVREGLRAIEASAFDLVVTDMYMPDEDGLDCLRQIRELRPDLPVIVMSGQLSGDFGATLQTVAMAMGAAATLGKSSNAALVELVETIAKRT